MGTGKKADPLPMLELSVPEFFVCKIGRVEPAGGDCVRIWMCNIKGNFLEPACTLVIPIADLAVNSRQCLHAAAALHTEQELLPFRGQTEH